MWRIFCAFLVVLAASGTSYAVEGQLIIPDRYRNPDGSLNVALIMAEDAKQRKKKGIPKSFIALSTPVPSTDRAPAVRRAVSATDPNAAITSTKFLLRKDFSDFYLFSAITPPDQAEGAAISWTKDSVANDQIWSIDGTAAFVYSYFHTSYYTPSPFVGFSVAPYLTVNKELHSKVGVDDTDQITVGGSTEFAFRSIFGFKGLDLLRARIAQTEDHVAGSRIDQVTGEWIPVYLSSFGALFNSINYNFMPEAKVQYDRLADGAQPLPFSDRNDALRIGPEFTLLWGIYAPGSPEWINRLSGKVTYHWWTEVYSSKSSGWLETSLTYNIDPDGNVGLSVSYKRGRAEQTGKQTNLFKVSLTAKPCWELPTAAACKLALISTSTD